MEILLLQLLDGLVGDGGRRRGENGDEGGMVGSVQRHRYTPYSTRREITKTDLHFSCLLVPLNLGQMKFFKRDQIFNK